MVASNYGGARHPAWYYNVRANPSVTLCGGGFEGRFVAEEITAPEYDRPWALAKQWNPGYNSTKHLPEIERFRCSRSRHQAEPVDRLVGRR